VVQRITEFNESIFVPGFLGLAAGIANFCAACRFDLATFAVASVLFQRSIGLVRHLRIFSWHL
jgi:hypothetical protein